MDMSTTITREKTAISSGNMELDSKMGGGLPVGSLVLIEGSSGAGKSVLSQQIMHGALLDGFRVSLFTSENTIKSLVRQMESIDLDILDYLLLGKFRAYPMELSHLGEQATAEVIQAMKHEHEREHDLIVVDSFTAAVVQTTQDQVVLSFFEESKRMCADGATIMVTVHEHSMAGELITRVRSMCDANLRLHTEQDGQKLVKTLEVAKIQGAASSTGAIVGFDVEPGWGMRVIPISKARG
jgi:archaeal flagellar protein FlaH